jgi:hypothetical protein
MISRLLERQAACAKSPAQIPPDRLARNLGFEAFQKPDLLATMGQHNIPLTRAGYVHL